MALLLPNAQSLGLALSFLIHCDCRMCLKGCWIHSKLAVMKVASFCPLRSHWRYLFASMRNLWDGDRQTLHIRSFREGERSFICMKREQERLRHKHWTFCTSFQVSHAPEPLLGPAELPNISGQIIFRYHLVQLPHFTDGQIEAQWPVSLWYTELVAKHR